MLVFQQSPEFEAWLSQLADQKGKARILARVRQATFGNFGDCEPVGEGVSEMRIHYGPAYRVYLVRNGAEVHLLLLGGDKSTQTRDIRQAKAMARKLKEQRK